MSTSRTDLVVVDGVRVVDVSLRAAHEQRLQLLADVLPARPRLVQFVGDVRLQARVAAADWLQDVDS